MDVTDGDIGCIEESKRESDSVNIAMALAEEIMFSPICLKCN